MAWHYQTTRADQWDYTATQKIILNVPVINLQSKVFLERCC